MPKHPAKENLSLKALADEMADLLGISKSKAAEALKSHYERIAQVVSDGGKVTLHQFGSFEFQTKTPRRSRGTKPTPLPPAAPTEAVLRFRPAKALKTKPKAKA